MSISAQDIAALIDLRDTLQRMTDRARASYGLTFDDEIAGPVGYRHVKSPL